MVFTLRRIPARLLAASPSLQKRRAKQNKSNTDVIRWGSKRRYLVVATVDTEKEVAAVLHNFVGIFVLDAELVKQKNVLIEQMHQTRV